MTFVSKLALAAVLTLGSTALTVTPAAAQKKKDEKKDENTLKVSEAFRVPAAEADALVKAKDWAGAEPKIAAAEAAAQNDDEKYYAARMRFLLEVNRNSAEGQLRALPILVASPRTPPADLKIYQAQYYFLQGEAASNAKKHAEAIPLLLKAREAGSKQPDISVMLANAYAATGKQAEAIAETDNAIQASKAAGRKPPESYYRFAISRVNASGDRQALASWLSRYITEFPTVANWRWAIVTFRETAGQPAASDRMAKIAKIDMFRLMRATNTLADRGDYADYAYSAQSTGLPWEAVAVIDEGRKSGKLTATDADTTRTYAASQTQAKNEGSLDKQATAAKTGADLANVADAYLASGDYAKALGLYDQALAKGGVDANEINLHRGIALHHLGRKDEAKAAFRAVNGGPFANLATLWQASLDIPPLA